MIMKILLIWDIDGTLLNVNRAGRAAMDLAFEKMFNIKNAFSKVNMSGRLDKVILSDALDVHQIQVDSSEVFQEDFFTAYEGILKELLKSEYEGVIYPGIRTILKETSSATNIVNAIGTGNCRLGALAKLESLDIHDYFKFGGYGDEYIQRGELIKGVVKAVNDNYGMVFDKENIYVIGDTIHDVNAAKYASVKSIAVLTGSDDYQKINDAKPDFIFEDLRRHEDFLNIFR